MGISRVIPQSEYKRAAWKNGLGHTDEIAIYPEGADLRAGNFLWRLSSARIERASPFSVFPHHDRTLVILKGAGVVLTHDFEGEEERVELPPLTPYEFPGDVASRCDLTSGGVTDLSVFVRKAEVEAVTDVAQVSGGDVHRWVPAGRWNFAFVAQGCCEAIHRGETRTLREGDTLLVELNEALSDGQSIDLRAVDADARVVFVSLQG